MEFHLDRRLQFRTDSEFKNLYSWSIIEVDVDGKVVGQDQIPWPWSLDFSATEISLSDGSTIKKRHEIEGELIEEAEIVHRRSITCKLRPVDLRNGDAWFCQTKYRMFGVDRVIKDFQLHIKALNSEDKTESCSAWGSVSYTSEWDFRDETVEDCIIFTLMVKPSSFLRYVERIFSGTAEEVIFSVSRVEGFYSEWSPSTTTQRVKVLTHGCEQELILPADFDFKPPRLGSVGEAELYIVAEKMPSRKPRSASFDEAANEEHQAKQIVGTEAAIPPAGAEPQTLKLLQSLRRATHWIIGLLTVLIIATVFGR